jgi:hypothetical protein
MKNESTSRSVRRVGRRTTIVGKEIPTRRRKFEIADLPRYCDYACPQASFAPMDAAGACRRELAVYCNLLARYNTKNARCAVRKDGF